MADEWKNGELSRMLYEEALKPNPLWEMFPPKPLSRTQRLRWRLEQIAYRVRRAVAVLRGEDDD